MAACSPEQATSPARPSAPSPRSTPVLLAANYPLAYFAERIAGEFAEVEFPGPPDEDPAFWMPDRETLRRFQTAELLLLNGDGYSKWVEPLALSDSRIVDTTASFRARRILLPSSSAHVHGPQGEEGGKQLALTTWIDPTLALEQATAIARALSRLDPDHSEVFEARLASLAEDLVELGERLERAVAPDPSRLLLTSHPVYAHLGRRFGLNLRSVHFEPDLHPSEEDWRELDLLRESHPANLILWEAEPLPETAQELQNRGIRSILFAPCASSPTATDWLESQRENAHELEEAYSTPH